MPLTYVKHEPVSLKGNTNLSEAWLHEVIKRDPAILGLGDVNLIGHELPQFGGGRLDLLLGNSELNTRYEVEIMLGATDPSHIIRCIEYWDVERRRYPAYDHIAVIVAEDITSRFLNVLGLFSGSIPMVAIQLNALQVGEQLLLNFVKVLDLRQLRNDPDENGGEPDADRDSWEAKVGATNMQICDRIADLANEVATQKLELKYKKGHVGLSEHGTFFNILALFPKKGFVPIRAPVNDPESWVKRLSDAGLEASISNDKVKVRLRHVDLTENAILLREFIHQAVKEYQA